MKKTIRITLLIAAMLAPAAIVAAKGALSPLSQKQCDTLCDMWWQAEDQITGLQGCKTDKCGQVRTDLLLYQATLAGIWDSGGCAKYIEPRPF